MINCIVSPILLRGENSPVADLRKILGPTPAYASPTPPKATANQAATMLATGPSPENARTPQAKPKVRKTTAYLMRRQFGRLASRLPRVPPLCHAGFGRVGQAGHSAGEFHVSVHKEKI